MKTLKITSKLSHWSILLLMFFVFTPNVNAQFLKKLQKRVEQKVENAVIEKTANTAAQKATKTMDKVFDSNPFGGGGGKEKADPALVADSYDFTWIYALKMTTKDGEVSLFYYLKPDAPYIGFTSQVMSNVMTIMDNRNNITVMFMKTPDGNNVGMVTQLPDFGMDGAQDALESFTYEALPDKTINGFDCKGVRAVNDRYDMTMYFIMDAPVNLDAIYKNSNVKIPDVLKDYFNADEGQNTIMISMDMKSLKNKKENITVECTVFQEDSKTINKVDYKFM